MAMNASLLALALAPVIEQNIRTYVIAGDITAYPQLKSFSQAMAEAVANEVVEHIVDNAEIKDGVCNGVATGTMSPFSISNQPVTGGIE